MHIETTNIDDLPGPIVDVDVADDGRVLILAGDESARSIWLNGRAIEIGPAYVPSHVRFVGSGYFVTAGITPDTSGLTLHSFEQPGIWTVHTGGDILDITILGQWAVMGFGDINWVAGLLAVPLTGHTTIHYREAFRGNRGSLWDCHCLCRVDEDRVALHGCPDSRFVIWNLRRETQRVASAPESLAGADALSIRGDIAYFFAPTRDEGREPETIFERRFRTVFSWRIGSDGVERVGEFQAAAPRVRGLPGGRFLVFEDDSYSVITV
ncbi:MAG: hypothetical protein ACK46X_04605 [Candidatus Sericytochromatia bacterium]